jgi:MtrB/PioB family decaheme-associated outer membrane protein
MARKQKWVSGLLVFSAALSGGAVAEEWDFSGSTAELGLGYLDEDAFRFGRFTGLTDKGVYVIGNADVEGWTDEGRLLRFDAADIGLSSRYLRLDYGEIANYRLFLEYDGIPNNLFDTAQTPFVGSGGDILALPPDWDFGETVDDMSRLDESLRPFKIETERRKTTAGARWQFAEPWTLDVKVSHETKDGTDILGAATGAGFGTGVGSVTSSILPMPVDYTTDQVEVKLGYAKGRGNLELAYYYSGFDNKDDSLTWQNPFASVSDTGVLRTSEVGAMALPPDNDFHRFALSGGYRLGDTTRLSGALSWGRMSQNQAFEPITVNPALDVTDGMPRQDLGDADIADVFLRLASRPLERTNVRATYRYHERDDDFDAMTYSYVVADSRPGGEVTTDPLKYQRHDFDLGGDYRFNDITLLSLDYSYERMNRDYEAAERKKTDENALYAKLRLDVHSDVQFTLYGGRADRDGSRYEVKSEIQNPLLRKYNYADRKQDKVGARVLWMPTDDVSVSASFDYLADDYNNSAIGLTDARHQVFSVDGAWVPLENLSLHGFWTYEDIAYTQANSEDDGPATWSTDLTDRVGTGGVGADYLLPGDRWRLGLTYAESQGTGQTDVAGANVTNNYPDIRSNVRTVELSATYNYSENLDLKFAWWYERYRSDDWALDGVEPDRPLDSVLATGEDSPNYDANVLMMSGIYRW